MNETKELPPMIPPEEVWHWFDENGNHQLGVMACIELDSERTIDQYNEHPDFYGVQQLMQDRYNPRLLRWVHIDKLTRYYGDNPPKAQSET